MSKNVWENIFVSEVPALLQSIFITFLFLINDQFLRIRPNKK